MVSAFFFFFFFLFFKYTCKIEWLQIHAQTLIFIAPFCPNLIDSHMPFCKLVAAIYINALHCLHWQVPMKESTTDDGKANEMLSKCRNVICVTCDHTRGENTLAHTHTHLYMNKRRIIVKIGKIVVFNNQLNVCPPCLTEISSTYRLCIINRRNWTIKYMYNIHCIFLIATRIEELASDKMWVHNSRYNESYKINAKHQTKEKKNKYVYMRLIREFLDHLLMCRIHKHEQNLITELMLPSRINTQKRVNSLQSFDLYALMLIQTMHWYIYRQIHAL